MAAKRDQPDDHLELEVDERFHRAEWRWQRAAWVMWSLVVVAALAGLAGSGPLSLTSTTSPNGDLRLEYERFERHHHQTSMVVHVRSRPSDAPIRLKIFQSLLNGINIDRIEPEPATRELATDGVIYSFPREPGAVDGKIIFHLQHEAVGKRRSHIGLVGTEPVELNQFIYP